MKKLKYSLALCALMSLVNPPIIISAKININNNLLIIIKGILEMTQGIKFVSISNYSIIIKSIFITFFLSFGGFSVHLQVSSIISDTKIKYKNFLIARIFHSFISIILVYIFYNLFY